MSPTLAGLSLGFNKIHAADVETDKDEGGLFWPALDPNVSAGLWL
jgi:hypothetical protein